MFGLVRFIVFPLFLCVLILVSLKTFMNSRYTNERKTIRMKNVSSFDLKWFIYIYIYIYINKIIQRHILHSPLWISFLDYIYIIFLICHI